MMAFGFKQSCSFIMTTNSINKIVSGDLSLYLKAASDSTTHGLIAMLSWLVVRYTDVGWLTMLEALACGLLSMAFDMDHFVAAKSWSLKVR